MRAIAFKTRHIGGSAQRRTIRSVRHLRPSSVLARACALALLVALAPHAFATSAVPDLSPPGPAETTDNDATQPSLLPSDPFAMAVAREISTADTLLLDAAFTNAGDESESHIGVQRFYEKRGYDPIWMTGEGLNADGETLLDALRASAEHALDPRAYDADRLEQLAFNAETLSQRAAVEVALSHSYIAFARDMMTGRVEPNEVNKSINIFPRAPDPANLLSLVHASDDFARALDALSPNTPNYARLKAQLAIYRAKARAGGFTLIPPGETLKPGMSDPRLATLRTRLAEQDLFTPASHVGDIYDGKLVEAVERFQERHGLAVDGIIGRNTLAELNVPIEARIAQMKLNMERRRWMADELGEFYVFVNLADQNLKVVSGAKTIHTTRVVVGKPYHATPVFSDEITYAEVNPFWTVPYSIATREYLPLLQNNPGAMLAKRIRVFSGNREVDPYAVNWAAYSRRNFPFTLRQDPGPGNALGRIKFMFPNKFSIYIHDTPSKSLFSRAQRSFSHGCIRAEDPFDLGAVLLGRDGWNKARLLTLRDRGQRRVINLATPIPVHLTYLTAWVNKDGSTHFRRDIYGRDKVLSQALAALAPIEF